MDSCSYAEASRKVRPRLAAARDRAAVSCRWLSHAAGGIGSPTTADPSLARAAGRSDQSVCPHPSGVVEHEEPVMRPWTFAVLPLVLVAPFTDAQPPKKGDEPKPGARGNSDNVPYVGKSDPK